MLGVKQKQLSLQTDVGLLHFPIAKQHRTAPLAQRNEIIPQILIFAHNCIHTPMQRATELIRQTQTNLHSGRRSRQNCQSQHSAIHRTSELQRQLNVTTLAGSLYVNTDYHRKYALLLVVTVCLLQMDISMGTGAQLASEFVHKHEGVANGSDGPSLIGLN